MIVLERVPTTHIIEHELGSGGNSSNQQYRWSMRGCHGSSNRSIFPINIYKRASLFDILYEYLIKLSTKAKIKHITSLQVGVSSRSERWHVQTKYDPLMTRHAGESKIYRLLSIVHSLSSIWHIDPLEVSDIIITVIPGDIEAPKCVWPSTGATILITVMKFYRWRLSFHR